ncbi:MAG: MBL fold metallo-hydrolase [Beutenbergiaceae bacterium]
MTGLCHVEPGSSALAIGDDDLAVLKVSVSSMDNNVYLLTDPTSGEQALIDAADDAERLLDLVGRHGNGLLRLIITTHRHWDHHRALAQLTAATGAQVLAGVADADALPVPVDRRVDHGDVVMLGTIQLTIIGLRGHTPGSIAVAASTARSSLLFSGDSLFPGGVGRTQASEDFDALVDDVENRLFGSYPDSAVVHPGHGDSTTLGAERPRLPQWRSRGW